MKNKYSLSLEMFKIPSFRKVDGRESKFTLYNGWSQFASFLFGGIVTIKDTTLDGDVREFNFNSSVDITAEEKNSKDLVGIFEQDYRKSNLSIFQEVDESEIGILPPQRASVGFRYGKFKCIRCIEIEECNKKISSFLNFLQDLGWIHFFDFFGIAFDKMFNEMKIIREFLSSSGEWYTPDIYLKSYKNWFNFGFCISFEDGKDIILVMSNILQGDASVYNHGYKVFEYDTDKVIHFCILKIDEYEKNHLQEEISSIYDCIDALPDPAIEEGEILPRLVMRAMVLENSLKILRWRKPL